MAIPALGLGPVIRPAGRRWSRSSFNKAGSKQSKTMKAIAIIPGKPGSVHLTDLAKPSLSDIPNGRGVLVKVLRVGVDGTDREISAAEYGAAPEGYGFLVIRHEGFGQVEAVGPKVSVLRPGGFLRAT